MNRVDRLAFIVPGDEQRISLHGGIGELAVQASVGRIKIMAQAKGSRGEKQMSRSFTKKKGRVRGRTRSTADRHAWLAQADAC